MKKPRPFLALIVLPVLASCTREASPPAAPAAPGPSPQVPGAPPKSQIGTRVHRKDAGEPDSTGWCVAQSSEGGFSVLLPTSFNDYTVTMPVEDGVLLIAETIGTVTEHDTKFTAFRAHRSDGKIHISSLEEIAVRFEKEGRLKQREEVWQDGNPGLEIRTEEDDRVGALRSFKVAGVLYQLSADYSRATAPPTINSDIAKFFDSFRIVEAGQR